MEILLIIISAVFVNNVVLAQFLGICPFLGVSNKLSTATGMSAAVCFVITLATLVTFLLNNYVLQPLELEFLQTISFILVIAALVQMVEIVLKKVSPSLYQALGIFLPLITTNCAVLGIAIINIDSGYNLLQSFFAGLAAGIGFTMAIVLMSNIREKLELTPVRKSFKGVPITFISAGIMALAFMAFDSSLLSNLGLV